MYEILFFINAPRTAVSTADRPCSYLIRSSPRVSVGDLRLVKLNKKTTFFVLNVSGRFPTTFLGNDTLFYEGLVISSMASFPQVVIGNLSLIVFCCFSAK